MQKKISEVKAGEYIRFKENGPFDRSTKNTALQNTMTFRTSRLKKAM